MSQFKDKIPAAGGEIKFLYDAKTGGIASQISGTGFMAMYMIAVSMDGRHLLDTVPATGIGVTAVYRQPSLVTYIQSDQQGMWGRNCPHCKKYFRTNHVMDVTICPYCADEGPSLAFISKEQRKYITAYYDAFARAFLMKQNSSLDVAEITDVTPAWHYEEEKQQFHFKCDTQNCGVQTDILGDYGYCPRCGRTNARKLFFEQMDKMLALLEETRNTVTDRKKRGEVWEQMTIASVSEFEPLAKHLRSKLLLFPITANRKRRLEGLNFQQPLHANTSLVEWFDIGILEWAGNEIMPGRRIQESDVPFIKKMLQKRHILIHNRGIVDQAYIDLSGDDGVRLNERISVASKEAKRFIECVRAMAANLLDNVEYGFGEG